MLYYILLNCDKKYIQLKTKMSMHFFASAGILKKGCHFARKVDKMKIFGGIPYTAHGAQIPSPPLFFIFVIFLFLYSF